MIFRWTWKETWPSSTTTSWPSTHAPLMPRIVSPAFSMPSRHASSKLSDDVAVSSMTFATDILPPFAG